MYGTNDALPCVGCELGSEVFYPPWSGWGAAPGETPSPAYSRNTTGVTLIDTKALIVLAIAIYIAFIAE